MNFVAVKALVFYITLNQKSDDYTRKLVFNIVATFDFLAIGCSKVLYCSKYEKSLLILLVTQGKLQLLKVLRY